MGVLRGRLGELEDKFFATVFLGSGLLFVACLFAAAAVLGALIGAVAAGNIHSPDSETYYLARRAIDALLNLFAMKMAGVFMSLDLHHRVAQRHSPALGGIYWLCLCRGAIGRNCELEMDRAGLPTLDAAGQHADVAGGVSLPPYQDRRCVTL